MYVVVFFLLLWTLFQLILCKTPNECVNYNNAGPNSWVLYILETNDHRHREINDQFLNYHVQNEVINSVDGVQLPFKRSQRLRGCSSRIGDIKKETNNLKYVIHLHVEDFYQNNYNVIRNWFSWAGDVDNEIVNTTVCRSNKIMRKDGTEICTTDTIVLQKHVKLVSNAVMSIPYLYDLILSFQFNTSIPKSYTNVGYKILVCKTKDMQTSSYKLTFNHAIINIIAVLSECKDNFDTRNKEIIAILAPNANAIQETQKPVIFYDEPYSVLRNTAFYKNSIIRTRSWKALAEKFLGFIRRMKWNRVAVLSDDSIKSVAFEEELRKVFEEGGVSYVVMTVIESNRYFNFSKALVALKQADARIIVANVDEQHADQLAGQTKRYQMNSSRMVLWLARDWSADIAHKAAQRMGTVYSVSPKRTKLDTYIGAIKRVIHNSYYHDDVNYNYLNHTQFASDIRQTLGSMDEYLDVNETNSKGEHKSIAYYKDNKWYTIKLLQDTMPTDRRADCNIPSTNYYKPCNDLEVVYLMLVIAMFATTVLGITFFFQTPDTPYNRMAN